MQLHVKRGRMGASCGKRHAARMIDGEHGGGSRFGGQRRRGEHSAANWSEGPGGRGHRGPGGGFGAGRGRGGRGRMFAGGELRLLLLKLVADESRHGYELIKAIEDLTGGLYAPSPGVVYPTLSMLVDEAMLVQQVEEGGRKAFAASDAGRAELAEKAEAAAALIARLRSLAEASDPQGSAPVRRAVGNLMAVLRGRLEGAPPETETIHAIVDLLDETAKRIERL